MGQSSSSRKKHVFSNGYMEVRNKYTRSNDDDNVRGDTEGNASNYIDDIWPPQTRKNEQKGWRRWWRRCFC